MTQICIPAEPAEVSSVVGLLVQEVTGVRQRTDARTGVGYPVRNIDLLKRCPAIGPLCSSALIRPRTRAEIGLVEALASLSEGFVLSIGVHAREMPFRRAASSLPSSDCVGGNGIAASPSLVQHVAKCKLPPLRRALMSKFTVVFGRPRVGGWSSPTHRLARVSGQSLLRTAADS